MAWKQQNPSKGSRIQIVENPSGQVCLYQLKRFGRAGWELSLLEGDHSKVWGELRLRNRSLSAAWANPSVLHLQQCS